MRNRKNVLCAALAAVLLVGVAWPTAAGASSETPAVTESPLFVVAPAGDSAPDTSAAPAASQAPAGTAASAVTESPLFTGAPSGSAAPAASQAPAGTAASAVTESPLFTGAPSGSASPAPTQAPELTGTASVMDAVGQPSGILVLEDGSLLVTDVYNKVIWQVTDGAAQVYAGGDTVADRYGEPMGGYNDADLQTSLFRLPWAIAPFLDGYAVSDADNDALRFIRADTVRTINCQTEERLTTSELGVVFQHPTGLAADDEGNLYVSDTLSNAIRKIDPEGNITTVTAVLTGPMGLCWKDGVLYVAETGANRIVRIGADGRVMVLAGGGQEGMNDGPSALASFSSPQGIAVDDDGTVYVADTANSAIRRIRGGVVDTLLVRDTADVSADTPVSPVGLMIRDGSLYVCDSFARKVFTVDLTAADTAVPGVPVTAVTSTTTITAAAATTAPGTEPTTASVATSEPFTAAPAATEPAA